ncbi:septum formation inhibitor MinC [Acetobacter lambici]|uniref:Probable septum site-determining protein MinC n=1 Tax=Acetobacter lambici TaxID=1332824 RepID=A0ABT1EWH3_9PROT|nr:septum site-determining protein MinC [Acetobacter lambici]MCP1241105.1 septum site-determining protein MinC [Acetobacter lambici]MCP1257223.1 septum site-determining protein MinC [Acetobacter lambici]NHO55713.1 septum formation inhibitor MinC [Acetobacter lambici]
MSGTHSHSPRIRMSGRSFLALTLTPETPLVDWLAALDHQIQRAVGFFAGKPVILDLSLMQANTPDLHHLLPALHERGIRVLGIEGGDRSWPAVADWAWPETPMGGRASGPVSIPEGDKTPTLPPTLVVEESVRSGQHIIWPDGDVVVLGAVSSGAEVTAGGSVHIYGALRGRAIAGIGGNAEARIFTRNLAAELVAIDGFYATAEEMDAKCTSKPAQVLLAGETLVFKPLP